MKAKWECEVCGEVNISDSKERHTMDWCSCKESAVDLEEHYCRFTGSVVNYKVIEKDE